MESSALSEPAKLLLLAALLAKDRGITNNGKSFLKEIILRRDPRLSDLLKSFVTKEVGDNNFMEKIHNLIQEESLSLYDELFQDTSLEVGKTLSKKERDQKNLNEEKSLIYGEVEYQSFYRVLRQINAQPGLTFYDLGSGTGKAVFAARLTQDFGKCIGIEILEGLHSQARNVVDKYNTKYRQVLCSTQNQHASVYVGSFLEYDWSDGDVVFANSTCFDDNLMNDMSQMAENLKPGSIVVTFTKGLTSGSFQLIERKRYKMSWGPATVFIHRRLNHDGTSVGPYKLNSLPSDEIEYEAEDIDKKTTEEEDDDDDDDDDSDYVDEEESESTEDDDDYDDEDSLLDDDSEDEEGDDDDDDDDDDEDESENNNNDEKDEYNRRKKLKDSYELYLQQQEEIERLQNKNNFSQVSPTRNNLSVGKYY
jgi:SAM-dependent methyltransferase